MVEGTSRARSALYGALGHRLRVCVPVLYLSAGEHRSHAQRFFLALLSVSDRPLPAPGGRLGLRVPDEVALQPLPRPAGGRLLRSILGCRGVLFAGVTAMVGDRFPLGGPPKPIDPTPEPSPID